MGHLNSLKIKSLIGLGLLMMCGACADRIKTQFSGETDQKRREQVLDELNLTRDQQEKIKQIWQNQKPLLEEKQAALLEARRELDLAMKQGAPNEELKGLFDKLEKRRGDLFTFRFDTVMAIREVLTSEQKQKFLGFGRWSRDKNKETIHHEP